MSDERGGRPMICATQVMRPGPTRIGRIGNITLPRTVPVMTLAACIVGGIVGLGIAMTLSSGLSSVLYGIVFGAAVGWFLVNYSPLKGESMGKWIFLQLNASRRGRYIDGERVTLGVGTAVLTKPPAGKIDLFRSAVRIPSTQYDERGVPISPKNRNVPRDGHIDPVLFAALSLPGESTTALTPTGGPDPARAKPRRPARTQPAPAAPNTVTAGKPQRLKD